MRILVNSPVLSVNGFTERTPEALMNTPAGAFAKPPPLLLLVPLLV
jgi:hypothetical protein